MKRSLEALHEYLQKTIKQSVSLTTWDINNSDCGYIPLKT